MEAMILAAGLGTRLRPLTYEIPKALIEVGGIPMLEHVALRLIEAGCTRLILNVHHHADQIRAFIASRGNFGIEVLISEEPERPLETGGGLKQAAPLFERTGSFIMHNSDILTEIDLGELMAAHESSGALATLAVREPRTPRYLVFDEAARFCGYGNTETNYEHLVQQPSGKAVRVDFCGVQAISPRIFDLMTEEGVFSIIKVYLRLTEQGETIRPHRVDGALWIDIGKPEQLEEARGLFE